MVMQDGAWPNPFDQAVLDWMVSIRTETLSTLVRAVTTVGNTVSLFAIGIVGFLYLLYRRRTGWALYCGLTQLFGLGLMVVVKNVFGRERPTIPPRMLEIDSLSFPSGHALNSMVVFTTFAVAAYALTGRRWPLVAAALGSVAIGLTRVYLAAHWMTDVLAGWTIGLAVTALGLAVRALVLRAVAARAQVITPGRAAPPDRPGGPPAAAE
ncbi:phosphatase PAP2 family protein [Tsukamurella sputi]|uniref:Phosphatase PAP2 family protein n=1 Tax=Tsukamurella sputi TaxID=2591848 RepID=A0A5C5RLJ1_9ACTN|nr:phosphatase PAP2 family protein [Tsukamurella sputi]TWS22955.1 phosphatase PAP2 family protein [Tsukamurella sputi]